MPQDNIIHLDAITRLYFVEIRWIQWNLLKENSSGTLILIFSTISCRRIHWIRWQKIIFKKIWSKDLFSWRPHYTIEPNIIVIIFKLILVDAVVHCTCKICWIQLIHWQCQLKQKNSIGELLSAIRSRMMYNNAFVILKLTSNSLFSGHA